MKTHLYICSECGNQASNQESTSRDSHMFCKDHPSARIDTVVNTRALGAKGGAAKSEAKSAAVRENGKLGGRPRKPRQGDICESCYQAGEKTTSRVHNVDGVDMCEECIDDRIGLAEFLAR